MKLVTRLRWALVLTSAVFVSLAMADDNFLDVPAVAAEEHSGEMREPATAAPMGTSNKRTYPGGMDEEDLQVQNHLPEASLRTDARYLQREVYKSLYNQELKDERQDAVEE